MILSFKFMLPRPFYVMYLYLWRWKQFIYNVSVRGPFSCAKCWKIFGLCLPLYDVPISLCWGGSGVGFTQYY